MTEIVSNNYKKGLEYDVEWQDPEDGHSRFMSRIFTGLGLFLALLSGLIFSLNSFFLQFFGVDYIWNLCNVGLMQMAFAKGMIDDFGLSLWPKTKTARALLIYQALVGALVICGSFFCVKFMPLSDALTILYTAPIFTLIFESFFARKKISYIKISCGIMLLPGVIYLLQPPLFFEASRNFEFKFEKKLKNIFFSFQNSMAITKDYYIGALIAGLTAVLNGLHNVTISQCKQISTMVLLWWTGVVCLIIGVIFLPFEPVKIDSIPLSHWIGMLLTSFFVAPAHYCMMTSLNLIDASIASFINSSKIIFVSTLQALTMVVNPNIDSLIGFFLVLSSVLISLLEYPMVLRPRRPRTRYNRFK